MKYLSLSVLAVCLLAAPSYGENVGAVGEVPSASLADFGLGSLQPMAEQEAQSIRGTGFAFVFGGSYSFLGAPSGYATFVFPGGVRTSSSIGLGGFTGGFSAAYSN